MAKTMNPDYYHPDNDKYMSNSQWKHWLECPERAHATFVTHEYKQPPNINFAIGSLVDALLLEPEKEQQVLQEYADLFVSGKTGKRLAAANDAYSMAQAVRKIPQIMRIVDASDKQASYLFELAGMQWKCRLDLISESLQLVADLKTTGDINGEAYVPRLNRRGNFIAQWDYRRQLALYREAARQNNDREYGVAIIAVEKKSPFDAKVIVWNDAYHTELDDALREVEEKAPEIQSMRDGITPVWRCEKCHYCATTRTDYVFTYSETEGLTR